MMTPRGAISAWFLALLMACASAQAQPVWDARQLVASKGASGSTALRAEGRDVATVDNARVAQLVEIVDKMGPQFGLRPDVLLVPGTAPNAFATRNKDGQPVVGFNPAMLDLIGRDVDMVATVVGHELAHLELKHVEESQSRRAAINIVALIAGAALGYNVARRGVDPTAVLELSAFGGTLVNRKFDRDQERAADELGMKAMNAAGYDVHAAPRVWVAMSRVTSGGSGWWTSTHPSHAERIETLEKLAVAMKPEGSATVASAPQPASTTAATPTEPRAGEVPSGNAASEVSTPVPVTLQPVACLLDDGTTETLPRVQCASRGGSPQ